MKKNNEVLLYTRHMDSRITSYGIAKVVGRFSPDAPTMKGMTFDLFRLKSGKYAWEFELMHEPKGRFADGLLKSAKIVEAGQWMGTTVFPKLPIPEQITGIEIK